MIHSRIESPPVPVEGMHMEVLVRYIVTGCIFCAPSGQAPGSRGCWLQHPRKPENFHEPQKGLKLWRKRQQYRCQNGWSTLSLTFFCVACQPGGGGGGRTRLLNWIGGCRWRGQNLTLSYCARRTKLHPVIIYLTKYIKCIPCCNIVLLGYTLSDWGC